MSKKYHFLSPPLPKGDAVCVGGGHAIPFMQTYKEEVVAWCAQASTLLEYSANFNPVEQAQQNDTQFPHFCILRHWLPNLSKVSCKLYGNKNQAGYIWVKSNSQKYAPHALAERTDPATPPKNAALEARH